MTQQGVTALKVEELVLSGALSPVQAAMVLELRSRKSKMKSEDKRASRPLALRIVFALPIALAAVIVAAVGD